MLGDVLELLVGREQREILPDAELREERVDRSELDSGPATAVAEIGRHDVVFAVRLEERERREPLEDLLSRPRPGESLNRCQSLVQALSNQVLDKMVTPSPGQLRSNRRLHLSTSMRSFRSEKVSAFVKALLDSEVDTARALYQEISRTYPIVVTRDLDKAKEWVRSQALASGLQAQRQDPGQRLR